MAKKMSAEWNLRKVLEEHHIHSTTELVPLLAERGINLSRIQAYRLATQPQSRVSMDLLAAFCDIFGCTPNDLITIRVEEAVQKKAVGETKTAPVTMIKSRVRRPGAD